MSNLYGIGVRIDGTDVGPLIIEGGTIDYGRSSVFDQPGAATCQLTLFTSDGYPQAPASWFEFGVGEWGALSGFVDDYADEYAGPRARLSLGAPVWVAATTDSGFTDAYSDTYTGAEFRRFTGRIQAIGYERERITLTCVDDLEAWAHVGIMTAPATDRPVELGTERAAWLATESPSPTTLHFVGDTGVLIRAIPATSYPLCLLAELQAIATDSDHLLYCDRAGRVTYRGDSTAAEWTAPPGIVEAESFAMDLELGAIENAVTVEFGEPDISGVRATASAANWTSVGAYGMRSGYYESNIDDELSAALHAEKIVATTAAAWNLPDVTLIMQLATDAQVADVCGLELADHVVLDTMPGGAPVPSITSQILGFTEYLASDAWEIELHLSPIPSMPTPG